MVVQPWWSNEVYVRPGEKFKELLVSQKYLLGHRGGMHDPCKHFSDFNYFQDILVGVN